MTHGNTAANLLRTAADVAWERAQEARELWERAERARKEQEKRANWASRLDASEYTARRLGRGWLAENERAGCLFQYGKDRDGNIAVVSNSGMGYTIRFDAQADDWRCSCPAGGDRPCKHTAGLASIRAQHLHEQLSRVAPPARLPSAEEEDAACARALDDERRAA